MAILVFFAISLVSAIAWHYFVPTLASATIGATISAVVAFQCAVALEQGYFSPYLLIGVVVSSVPAAVISLLIGLGMRSKRSKEGSSAP